jgi:hypothetical protein
VDVVLFGRALSALTLDEIRDIASDLAAASASTADEVAATRSVMIIEQTLRRTHRLPNAAAAALVAATTVQDVAVRAQIALPDDDVTRVARAAAQLARGLVVSDSPAIPAALRCLGRGWSRLSCMGDLAAA